MNEEIEPMEQEETQNEANTIMLSGDVFPEGMKAKPGKEFNLMVRAKVVAPGEFEVLSVEDQSFKDKSYRDIVSEDMGTEQEGE